MPAPVPTAARLLVLAATAVVPLLPLGPAAVLRAGEAVLGPDEVLARHNAWADGIRHLWARAEITLNFPADQEGRKREQHDLAGHLFLAKPDRLFLHGQVLGKDVFVVGMNAERFWLWIRPEVNTVWTGRRGGPGERRLIVSPTDLMAALGLCPLTLEPSAPAEFVALPRHYVLTQRWPAPDGAGADGPADPPPPRRRVWFDRRHLRPVRVDLFDESGRRLLLAELLRYEPVGPGGIDLCTAYRARFYGEGREVVLVLRLTKVRPEKEPNPRIFTYRPPPGAKVRDLDAGAPVP